MLNRLVRSFGRGYVFFVLWTGTHFVRMALLVVELQVTLFKQCCSIVKANTTCKLFTHIVSYTVRAEQLDRSKRNDPLHRSTSEGKSSFLATIDNAFVCRLKIV